MRLKYSDIPGVRSERGREGEEAGAGAGAGKGQGEGVGEALSFLVPQTQESVASDGCLRACARARLYGSADTSEG